MARNRMVVVLFVLACVLVLWLRHDTQPDTRKQQPVADGQISPDVRHLTESDAPLGALLPNRDAATNRPQGPAHDVRIRASKLSDDEKAKFVETFQARIKPAVHKWCKAYEGHVPFSLDALTLECFVERIGIDPSYYEYVFVVEGVTLGVRDSKRDSGGAVRVVYLNAPQSKKLMDLPAGSAPSVETPVARKDVVRMLKLDSGVDFEDSEIRLIPSGLSSAMIGGVQVHVGGDTHNFLSWKYTLVFGPDGNLAYYCKGLDILAK